jgi:hypothetical protein
MARVSIEGPTTPAEAAAISAAVERFVSDTSLAPPPAETGMDPWLKAALIEGVSAKDSFGPGDPGGLLRSA